MSHDHAPPDRIKLIKAPQDFLGGFLIVGVSIIALASSLNLPLGTLSAMGPGMMPRSVAFLLGILGIVLIVQSIITEDEPLSGISIRSLIVLLAAIIIFAYCVRPLGLLVAIPLTVIIAALATSEVRFWETLLFSAVMTVFCIGLFKFALGLPVPLAPWLVGY